MNVPCLLFCRIHWHFAGLRKEELGVTVRYVLDQVGVSWGKYVNKRKGWSTFKAYYLEEPRSCHQW